MIISELVREGSFRCKVHIASLKDFKVIVEIGFWSIRLLMNLLGDIINVLE